MDLKEVCCGEEYGLKQHCNKTSSSIKSGKFLD